MAVRVQHYRRDREYYNRAKKEVAEDRKLKPAIKWSIALVGGLLSGAAALLGFDYGMILIPTLTILVMLIGTLESTGECDTATTLLVLSVSICDLLLGQLGIMTIVRGVTLFGYVLMVAVSRPLLWSWKSYLVDFPLWTSFYFLVVTNVQNSFVLVLKVILIAAVTTGLTVSSLLGLKSLLANGGITKWTEVSKK